MHRVLVAVVVVVVVVIHGLVVRFVVMMLLVMAVMMAVMLFVMVVVQPFLLEMLLVPTHEMRVGRLPVQAVHHPRTHLMLAVPVHMPLGRGGCPLRHDLVTSATH